MPPSGQRSRRSALWLTPIAGLYLAGLLWADRQSGALDGWRDILSMIWLPAALSLPFWLVRFLRWQYLLAVAGHRLPLRTSLTCYLAGFAFTATPGKVGELVRIRYLTRLGVPSQRVLAASVFERLNDLFVVLLLALPAAAGEPLAFASALTFVSIIVLGCGLAASRPQWLVGAAKRTARFGRAGAQVARLVGWLAAGLSDLGLWVRPRVLVVSLALGLAAWTLNAATLVVILDGLGVPLPAHLAWSLLPLATIAGAASLIPGGIGSTELVIVTVLAGSGVALARAVLAAMAARFCTLWLSIGVGLIAVAILERGPHLRSGTH